MITSNGVSTGVPGTQLPSTTTGLSNGNASTTGTGANGGSSGGTTNSSALLSQNFNTFLTLLTTQLQNQDPLSPLDTNQFTQQLVSFSEVEQQINTNTNLQSLISLQQTSQALSALPLVGQTIQYNNTTAPLSKGQASFSYTLPANVNQATLVITDSNGQTQFAEPAPSTAAGPQNFVWNGQTLNGNTAPAGNYTLSVSATDVRGNALSVPVTSTGVVSGISVQNNVATFNVNGISVPMSELVTVVPQSSSN